MSTSFLKKLEEFYKSGISTCCIERVTDSERLLKLIGGTPAAGNMAVNRNTLGKKNATIINNSVTGLFVEKRNI